MGEQELICPCCDMPQYTHEPDSIPAFLCLTECEHCGKKFWYSVSVRMEYDATKYEELEDAE